MRHITIVLQLIKIIIYNNYINNNDNSNKTKVYKYTDGDNNNRDNI